MRCAGRGAPSAAENVAARETAIADAPNRRSQPERDGKAPDHYGGNAAMAGVTLAAGALAGQYDRYRALWNWYRAL